VRRLWAVFGATSILIAACTSTATQPNPSTAPCFDPAKVRGLYEEWAHAAGETYLACPYAVRKNVVANALHVLSG
jgi:hypothetical protein